MADKLEKIKTLRQIELNRLDDLLAAAGAAKSNKSCEPVLKIRYQEIDYIKFEFNKQQGYIIIAVLMEASLPDKINIGRDFDNSFYKIKDINKKLSRDSRSNTESTSANNFQSNSV
ncbi:hypothetical protein JTB14_037014 [Gonioctena quinquepunctata]|nr:hypothetical protein JTB14_037014 [Gonioctena quinquepunctata]